MAKQKPKRPPPKRRAKPSRKPPVKQKRPVKKKRVSPAAAAVAKLEAERAARQSAAYEKKKLHSAAVSRAKSEAGRDIGELPPVADPKRRERCGKSFKLFCETYLQHQFPLAWSSGHKAAIAKIDKVVRKGGLFALAMPRSRGKTTLCRAGALFALAYRYHLYIVLIAATEGMAQNLLRDFKKLVVTSPLLAADFPELCGPILALKNVSQKASGQLYHDEPTGLEWKGDRAHFADLDGVPGAILETCGITGSIRGRHFVNTLGQTMRPTLILLDDPQTKASARSHEQTNTREEIIQGDVLGLGEGALQGALMACTVIHDGDLSARYLSHDLHPDWQGECSGVLEGKDSNSELRLQYFEERAIGLAAGDDGKRANAFYRKHRREFETIWTATWPAKKEEDEISAVQSALNIWARVGDVAFWAEYQNAPLIKGDETFKAKLMEFAAKANGRPRGELPDFTQIVVGFVDLGIDIFWNCVAAFGDQMSAAVIDYGYTPDQKVKWFSKGPTLPRKLSSLYPGLSDEVMVTTALRAQLSALLERTYTRPDGATFPIDYVVVDRGWGEYDAQVIEVCNLKEFRGRVTTSKGYGVSPHRLPMSEWKPKPGEVFRDHWMRGAAKKGGFVQGLTVDTNTWKSRVHRAIRKPKGDPGCLEIFGDAKDHELFFAHVCESEDVRTEPGLGRMVDIWQPPPRACDNDLFDCLVGCFVAASVKGLIGRPVVAGPKPAKRKGWRVMGGG